MIQVLRALVVGLLLIMALTACGGGEPLAESRASGTSAAPSSEGTTSESASASITMDRSPAAIDQASGGSVELPLVIPAEQQGSIVMAGSSTVFPLAQAIAERWTEEGGPPPTIDSIGSGAGVERFCVAAETDVANASRPINEEERQACIDQGREPIEFRVGTDALAIVVSAENDFLEEVTLEDLAQIFADDGAPRNWSDINPDYPNEPIQRFIPGTDSGTFDYFVEEIFDEDQEPILGAANTQQSEDDNVLVTGIEASPYAIGFFGYAYYQENQERLKILTVDGVEPNEETAEDSSYPLSRPLFIYSAQSIMEEKPQVAAWINYFLANTSDVIEEVGYFPASTQARNEAKQAYLDATGELAQ